MNCTLQGNTAGDLGGAVWAIHASLAACNSIFWGNTGGDEIVIGDAVSATINHCCVEGGVSSGGTAILTEDPHFFDAAGHDFRLQSSSPCLNTGTWVDAPDGDIRGVTRPQGAGIDIGAYEMAAADYE